MKWLSFPQYHAGTIKNVREAVKIVSEDLGIPSYPVAVALDTKGPEIRTGLLCEVMLYGHKKNCTFYNYKNFVHCISCCETFIKYKILFCIKLVLTF